MTIEYKLLYTWVILLFPIFVYGWIEIGSANDKNRRLTLLSIWGFGFFVWAIYKIWS